MREQLDLGEGNSSLSFSRRDSFRACARKYWFQYVLKAKEKETPAPLRMGSVYSDGMEHGDSDVVSELYNELIMNAVGESQFALASRMKTELHIVRPMVKTYLDIYGKVEVEREHPFIGIEHEGYRDNGYLDGLSHRDDKKVITENKLMGRWDRTNIEGLVYNEQLTSYFFNVVNEFGTKVEDVFAEYHVAKKPQLRVRKDETIDSFNIRVEQDILSRPEFYHWANTAPITRSQEQLDEWLELFKLTADAIDLNKKKEESGEYAWPKNTRSCSDYGGCKFLPICWANTKEEGLAHLNRTFDIKETNG